MNAFRLSLFSSLLLLITACSPQSEDENDRVITQLGSYTWLTEKPSGFVMTYQFDTLKHEAIFISYFMAEDGVEKERDTLKYSFILKDIDTESIEDIKKDPQQANYINNLNKIYGPILTRMHLQPLKEGGDNYAFDYYVLLHKIKGHEILRLIPYDEDGKIMIRAAVFELMGKENK